MFTILVNIRCSFALAWLACTRASPEKEADSQKTKCQGCGVTDRIRAASDLVLLAYCVVVKIVMAIEV
jgi:hypothetical protein